MRSAALLLALGLLAGACKDRREGVAVTEAPPVGMPAAPGLYTEGDSVYTDAAFADSLRADSIAAVDSLRADSLAAATPAVAPAPDFRAFWTSFRTALRTGRRAAVAPLALVGPGGIAPAEWPDLATAVLDDAFRTSLVALDATALRRDGDARIATAVVAYDAEGTVVPQDEADTDSAVALRFEIVEVEGGPAWRLVRVDVAG